MNPETSCETFRQKYTTEPLVPVGFVPEDYAHKPLPDVHAPIIIVHELSGFDMTMLLVHETYNLSDESREVTIIPNFSSAFVRPDSKIGAVLKANEDKTRMKTGQQLLPFSIELPMYVVPKERLLVALKSYNDKEKNCV